MNVSLLPGRGTIYTHILCNYTINTGFLKYYIDICMYCMYCMYVCAWVCVCVRVCVRVSIIVLLLYDVLLNCPM